MLRSFIFVVKNFIFIFVSQTVARSYVQLQRFLQGKCRGVCVSERENVCMSVRKREIVCVCARACCMDIPYLLGLIDVCRVVLGAGPEAWLVNGLWTDVK